MSNVIVTIRDYSIKKDGTCPLYLQTFINKQRVEVPVGLAVKPKQWDNIKKRVIGNDDKVKDYNYIIMKALSRANEIFIKYRLQMKLLTPDQFRTEYRNPTIHIDFYNFIEHEIELRKETLARNTYFHHNSMLKKLKNFKSSLTFSELTYELLERFDKWLRLNANNNENTISQTMKYLKIYIKRAIKKEYLTKDPFAYFKIRTQKSRVIFLEESELNKMINYYRKRDIDNYHKIVCRHFLFMCMTGLRVSDMQQLDYSMIANNKISLIPKKTEKTKGEICTIPLSKSALRLIKEENLNGVYGKVFRLYNSQLINIKLKEIATKLKIKKPVSTHLARHTFATLFIQRTGDVATLSKILGHSSVNQTMQYVTITEDLKVKRMRAFDNFLKC